MSVKALVVEVGARLGRSAADVEPFLRSLADNWYDSVNSVRDATADDLTSAGLPRRFAVELTAAAAAGGKGGDRKSKSKGKGNDEEKGDRKGDRKGGGRGRNRTVPIDLNGLDPEFLFKPKVLGKRGSHVHHIQDQTGVTIDLQGTDADGYMELVITGEDNRAMNDAKRMCEDLVNTIFSEYDDFAAAGGKRGGKGDRGKGDRDGKGKKGKGKGKEDKGKGAKGKDGKDGKGKERRGKGKGPEEGEIEERVPVDAEGVDPEFYLRAKLVGKGGANVKHIEDETGCRVRVAHDDGDGMAFVIHNKDEAAIATAREMCQDLLVNVMEEAGKEAEAPSGEKRPRGGKGKRGKGKGKRDGDDGEDRPRKAAKTE